MELNFATEDAKLSFMSRLENAKVRLAPRGSPPLDSRELLSSLIDMAEATPPTNQSASTAWGSASKPDSSYSTCDNARQLRFVLKCVCMSDITTNKRLCSGFFVAGDEGNAEAQSLFMCERKTFNDLCMGSHNRVNAKLMHGG